MKDLPKVEQALKGGHSVKERLEQALAAADNFSRVVILAAPKDDEETLYLGASTMGNGECMNMLLSGMAQVARISGGSFHMTEMSVVEGEEPDEPQVQ